MRKGKFNIIDVIVVLLVLALVSVVGWYFLRDGGSTTTTKSGDNEVIFTVKAYELEKDAVDQLKVGAPLVALDTYQPGEIVAFEVTPSKSVEAINGELLVIEDYDKVDITVTVKAYPNIQRAYMDFGNQQIIVGNPYWVKTDAMHAEGIIVSIED